MQSNLQLPFLCIFLSQSSPHSLLRDTVNSGKNQKASLLLSLSSKLSPVMANCSGHLIWQLLSYNQDRMQLDWSSLCLFNVLVASCLLRKELQRSNSKWARNLSTSLFVKEVEQDKESTQIILKEIEEEGKENCSGIPSLETRLTTINYSQWHTERAWTDTKEIYNTALLCVK